MNLVGRLPERFRGIANELAKFGTIGVINLVVNFAVVNLLWATVLSGSEVKAKAIATVVATTSAYFMNRHWTYRDRPKSTLRREYALFFFFNLIGLIIEVAVIWVAKYGLHQAGHILALNFFAAIGIVLGTAFRFWAYRTHVFLPHPVSAKPATTVVPSAVPVAASGPAATTVMADRWWISLPAMDRGLADEIELDGIVALSEQPTNTRA